MVIESSGVGNRPQPDLVCSQTFKNREKKSGTSGRWMVNKIGRSTNMLCKRSLWTGRNWRSWLGAGKTRDGLKVVGRSAWKAAERGIGKKEVNEHSKSGGQLSNPSKKRGM